jgi:hypothetical protein
VQLLKALYGCKQSSLLWFLEMKKTLISLGFTANPYDPCVFRKGEGEESVTILLYVDDLFLFAPEESIIQQIASSLEQEYEDVKLHMGNKLNYLGMLFNFEDDCVDISMDGYIKSILDENHVTGNAKTPAGENLFYIDDGVALPEKDQKRIHRTVAQLLFLATRVRPDLLLAVNFLATRVNKCNEGDDKKLKRCLNYLNATKDLHLRLRCKDAANPLIRTHADASYGVHADHKSQSASATTLGSGAIMSSSNKQKIMTKSAAEAELIAASDVSTQSLGLRNYMVAQGHNVGAVILGQDNEASEALINKGPVASKRTKHLNIRHFHLTDYVNLGELIVEHVKTEDMVADLLTKPLQGEQFVKLRNKLLGYDMSDWE